MLTQLRDMFVSILVYNSVANPITLWNNFKANLAKESIYWFQHKEQGIAPGTIEKNIRINHYKTE